MEFKKLSLNSKELLDEIVQSENPTQLLSDRFDHVSGKEDEILREIIRELCQAGYISIPVWGDNKPGHVVVNQSARTYDATISANGEANTPFFKLIDEIPNLSNCFQNMGGVQTIYTHPMFIKWKENVKYEVRQLKQDPVTTELIRLLDSFNGYSDRKMLSEAKAKCKVIRDHYGEYLKKNDSGGNIEVNKRKVFIVHGHDTQTRDNVELFLHRLGLEPVILANEPSSGRTVIEKFTDNSDVSFAIILYTACDEGRAKGSDLLISRARQNVIFEHGYFYAKLGQGNVVALYEPGVEIPSDLAGVLYISLDSEWKSELKKEMKAAGIDADWTKG